jgi:hypothetical protein
VGLPRENGTVHSIQWWSHNTKDINRGLVKDWLAKCESDPEWPNAIEQQTARINTHLPKRNVSEKSMPKGGSRTNKSVSRTRDASGHYLPEKKGEIRESDTDSDNAAVGAPSSTLSDPETTSKNPKKHGRRPKPPSFGFASPDIR